MLLSIGGTQNIPSRIAATTLLQAHNTLAVTLAEFYLKIGNITNNAAVKMTRSRQLCMQLH